MKNEFSIASLSGLQLVGMFSGLSPGREHTRPKAANQLIVTLSLSEAINENEFKNHKRFVLWLVVISFPFRLRLALQSCGKEMTNQ